VSFTPTGVGAETGTLTFTDNATNSPQTVALTGTGTNAVATTTTLTSSPEGSDFGQPVVFTATVTSSNGAPPNGEEVAFETRKGALGIGTLSNGSASLTIADLPLGTSKVTAVYGGDATFVGSTSNILEEGVFPAPTATTLDSSVNPSTYGQPVTFTAIVAASGGGIPGGQVNFHDGAFLVHGELEGGVATYTPHKLNVGTTAIIGDYDPDGRKGFIPSSNAVTQVVNQASTTATIFSSLNPSNTGQSLTFTATITGQFGGTVAGKVTFMDGTTVLGTADISRGSAKYTTKKLAAGSHNITATYGGSTDFTGSSASLAQTVN
jgi:hypothetical protein